jgi:hypothetical protein
LAEESKALAPLTLLWGAGLLLGLLVMLIFRLSAQGPSDQNFVPARAAQNCELVSASPLNIRAGPGFDYSRIWVLEAGQSRRALAQNEAGGGDWLALENGWVPRQAVQLNSIFICNQLPPSQGQLIFQDHLQVPASIAALDWYQILEESFATDLNGWLIPSPANTAAIREGNLVLFAFGGQTAQAYPQAAASYYPLSEAYYGLSASWIASDEQAEFRLKVRASEEGAYELRLRRDGALSLNWQPAIGPAAALDENFLPGLAGSKFELGLLHQGTRLALYVNGQRRFEVRHDAPPAGNYALELSGTQASLQVHRFEILIPPARPAEEK